jgi:hypothetical protein
MISWKYIVAAVAVVYYIFLYIFRLRAHIVKAKAIGLLYIVSRNYFPFPHIKSKAYAGQLLAILTLCG